MFSCGQTHLNVHALTRKPQCLSNLATCQPGNGNPRSAFRPSEVCQAPDHDGRILGQNRQRARVAIIIRGSVLILISKRMTGPVLSVGACTSVSCTFSLAVLHDESHRLFLASSWSCALRPQEYDTSNVLHPVNRQNCVKHATPGECQSASLRLRS